MTSPREQHLPSPALPSRPRMLVIGASGRNTGKTTLACRTVASLAKAGRPVVAAKFTTVHERDGTCPRGGVGCGVCSSLEEDVCITEETTAGQVKDTQRLLAAGATKVYWVRVHAPALADAVAALDELVPPEIPLVCESTSLRTVTVPGVFVLTQRQGVTKVKPSARRVLHHTDAMVHFDGSSFDLPEEDLTFRAGRWTIRRGATAAILAGGASSRMGTDKGLIELDGTTMVELQRDQLAPHVAEILVNTNHPDRYRFLSVPLVEDEVTGMGPLMGIASVLEASAHERVAVVACDIPEIDVDFLATMLRMARDACAVVPVTAEGFMEPLFAVYTKSFLPHARRALDRGDRRIRAAFADAEVLHPPLPHAAGLLNLNTPDDLAAFKAVR